MTQLDPSIASMLDQLEREIATLTKSFEALATSVIPLLPIRLGQRVTLSGGRTIVADSIKFDPCCYYANGKWRPGFSVFGMMASHHTTRHRIVLDLNGAEVQRAAQQE